MRKKYGKKELAAKVEEYFLSISRVVPVTEPVDSGRRDGWGHVIYDEVPVINELGEQATRTDWIRPPTVGDLCLFLDIDESTWARYSDENSEHCETTARARGRMHAYLQEQLLTRKDTKGIIFNLKNNYGWSEKTEVELGKQAARAVTAAQVPVSERLELLKQIAEEFKE